MATIYLTLSTKVDVTEKQEILLRFSHGRINQRARSSVFVFAKYWENPLTHQSEIRPLNKVASSHLARRTFCGNLYKKVKDPNLVGSLSGHAEGSKAFARYRDIDEEMKIELVSLIE